MNKKALETKVEYLNRLTGSPIAGVTKMQNGDLIFNQEHFYLDWTLGKPQLEQLTGLRGSCSVILSRASKAEFGAKLNAFIDGIVYGKILAEKSS